MRERRLFAVLALLGSAVLNTRAEAGIVLIDQLPDGITGLSSEEMTAIPSSRTAEDVYQKFKSFTARKVTTWMIVTSASMPTEFRLDFYEADWQNDYLPGELRGTFESGAVVDLGPYQGDPDYHLVKVKFFVRMHMPGGINWLSSYAIGNGSGTDRGWWATSGGGEVNNSEGFFTSEHFGFPDWTSVGHPDLLGEPFDFAMLIEGSPAAGTLPFVSFGLVARRSRRR